MNATGSGAVPSESLGCVSISDIRRVRDEKLNAKGKTFLCIRSASSCAASYILFPSRKKKKSSYDDQLGVTQRLFLFSQVDSSTVAVNSRFQDHFDVYLPCLNEFGH